MKTITRIMLTLLMASIVITLASPIPIIAQTDSKTTVYLDPPTITGVTIGDIFTVNMNILDAHNIFLWQAGMTFNATVLNCIGYFEGEFLESGGETTWFPGSINNDTGVITFHVCSLSGADRASGSGRLAYLTFEVIAPGVSDMHLRDVVVLTAPGIHALINIIDVFTVVWETTHYTVVTVSDSTGKTGKYSSGFYNHAFIPGSGISFNVTGPNPGFSNVTIPKTLMWVDALDEWKVIIDGTLASRTVTESPIHTSIYFTYNLGIHEVRIIGTYVIGSPPPVGGIWITPDKFKLLAPWIGLALIIVLPLVVTVVFVKLKKKKQ